PPRRSSDLPPAHQPSMKRALATSIPMALWVFSTAIIALVTLTERVAPQVNAGVLLPGIASLLAFTSGVLAQGVARRFAWGPRAGIVAASIAGAGLLLAGIGGQSPTAWLFVVATLMLGTASGVALREAPGGPRGLGSWLCGHPRDANTTRHTESTLIRRFW